MARIESLNVLLTDSGKVYLAEQYGAVIENIQKGTIASALKNTNLSGTPGAGSYEAKRFVNRTSNAYGTARSGGKGQAVKANPVTVKVDTDKELVTEVEQKDVSLIGIDVDDGVCVPRISDGAISAAVQARWPCAAVNPSPTFSVSVGRETLWQWTEH